MKSQTGRLINQEHLEYLSLKYTPAHLLIYKHCDAEAIQTILSS